MKHALLNRRQFQSIGLAATAAGLGLGSAAPAFAQGAPVEGQQFQKLASPIPMASTGKVEVVEFFWYGCPHCFALEEEVEKWSAKLPPDVNFRRVPAAFNPQYEFHQRVFYAFEAMGQLGNLHRKFFNAIHVEKKRLFTEPEVVAWLGSQGLDGAKFSELMKSFSVLGKVRQARQLAMDYQVDGVPMLGIQGRYKTSPTMVGSAERTFFVVDYVVNLVRKG